MVKKSEDPRPRGEDGQVATDTVFAKRHPELWSHLADEQYEDGSPRERSTLMVFVEDGLVKLCLNDRDQNRTAWISALTLQEAMGALEKGLAGGRLDWRVKRPQGGSGRSRKGGA